ncbi:MAG TPA: Gfo/Idh/MocA family oxidoreductase [Pirellulaceae bacterium]|nr:Gfo/Idh/MocA family oxidoreductase [Pirellulaceae bacterium]
MLANYKVAVIGHTGRGNYGHDVDRVWLEVPGCEIVAVSDPVEAGRKAAAQRLKCEKTYADYRQMLDEVKPQIVSIGPRWLDQHRDMVLTAAERGIHIYMEKPFCRTPAEADEMIAACEKKNVKLALAHQTRYSPKLPVIKNMIADGQIGDILELRGRGKEDARGGGEDLWVLGSHVMNLIHYFGGEPQWCFGKVLQNGKPVGKADVKDGNEGIGPLAGDQVTAMYGCEDGVTAYFGSRKGAAGNRFGLQIYGSKGVIEILTGSLPGAFYLNDPSWSPGRTGKNWVPISSAGPGQPETLKDGGLLGGNIIACNDLVNAIEEDRQPECNMYDARTTIEMISAVFQSHVAGGPVPMPLKDRENGLKKL